MADATTVDISKCKEVGMNDYLSKPIDERLLYNKIIGLVSKPIVSNDFASNKYGDAKVITPPKYVNLSSLSQRTKENKLLMIEMIEIYIGTNSTFNKNNENKVCLIGIGFY